MNAKPMAEPLTPAQREELIEQVRVALKRVRYARAGRLLNGTLKDATALVAMREDAEAAVAVFEAGLAQSPPVDMVLFCPNCGLQHIDEPRGDWANPPHRSHLCLGCAHVWRVADVATNGIRSINTFGRNDSPRRVRGALAQSPPPVQAEALERVRGALKEITEACEIDCGIPDEDDGDDEPVGGGDGGNMALTFGILRRARAALKDLASLPHPGAQGPEVWRPSREALARQLEESGLCVPLKSKRSDAEFYLCAADAVLALLTAPPREGEIAEASTKADYGLAQLDAAITAAAAMPNGDAKRMALNNCFAPWSKVGEAIRALISATFEEGSEHE